MLSFLVGIMQKARWRALGLVRVEEVSHISPDCASLPSSLSRREKAASQRKLGFEAFSFIGGKCFRDSSSFLSLRERCRTFTSGFTLRCSVMHGEVEPLCLHVFVSIPTPQHRCEGRLQMV